MRPPRFWHSADGKPGWQARLLSPLGALYAAGTRWRLAKGPGYRAGCPVICIGNINAGGTGKTPTAIACAQILTAAGLKVAIVSRGYGGSMTGPVRVAEDRHSAADVGDEPLLLAAFVPTWVAKDRASGVQAAEAWGADVVLLDDGLQSPAVVKDASIVVVDAQRGFGNRQVIPAGPLREPVSVGMARADVLVSVGNATAQERFDRLWGDSVTVPRVKATLKPLPTGMAWEGLPVLAFAGIGHPEKFFATLRELGANLLRAEALSDHQPLTPALMARIEGEAKLLGAQMVTTEKDAVRLPDAFRQKVLTVPVRLAFEDPGPIAALFERVIPR